MEVYSLVADGYNGGLVSMHLDKGCRRGIYVTNATNNVISVYT